MAVTVHETRQIRVASGTVWRRWLALLGPRWYDGDTAWLVDSRFAAQRPALMGGERDYVGTVQSVVDGQMLVCELQPASAAWNAPVLVESMRLDGTPSGSSIVVTMSAHGPFATLWRGKMQGYLQRQLDALQRDLAPAERRQ